jgi:hypothetical protein
MLSARFVIKLQPFPWMAQTHVNIVGRPLKFKHGGLSPLGKQALSGIQESNNSHAQQKCRHRQQQKKHQALLQAPHLYHEFTPVNLSLVCSGNRLQSKQARDIVVTNALEVII